MRQVVLDTETTGLDTAQGHRIIEIGCVEIVNRRITANRFHHYVNPEREIEAGAIEVHGITSDMLADKPRFAEIATRFIDYIRGAELIIHNAPFDVGFIEHELKRSECEPGSLERICERVTDTLALARKLHPGQRNSLDALCKRYNVDNSGRELHGALLDAEILADVYLAMTGGQATLMLGGEADATGTATVGPVRRIERHGLLPVVRANADEVARHESRLDAIDKTSGGLCLWRGDCPARA